MPLTRAQFGGLSRRTAAVLLGLWLGGAGCLLCCERAGVAAPYEVSAAAEAPAPSPAASNGHSCCKARVGSGARSAARRESAGKAAPSRVEAAGGVLTAVALRTVAHFGEGLRRGPAQTTRACCRRAIQLTEQPRRPGANDTQAQAVGARMNAPLPRRDNASPRVPARSRAPDRGGTYLRDCAFLI